ncbi:MAG: class III signal peptide-containing protein [Candidatus Diapherotrites archaeon]|nr:class III signal peptide-containing protein [Candidatus Diapherotrites archaeon]
MDNRAQGALEYLLIIGAALIVAAVVILVVTNALSLGKNTVNNATTDVNSRLTHLRNLANT